MEIPENSMISGVFNTRPPILPAQNIAIQITREDSDKILVILALARKNVKYEEQKHVNPQGLNF
jgi:hypothetical protein